MLDNEEASQGDANDQHEWQTWQGLTQSEKDLTRSNPSAALTIYENRKHAFQITEGFFKNISQHNSAADAFRHAYFNALNARDIGISLTIAFSYAHEDFPGNPQLERVMDLNNNLIGMGLGEGPRQSNADIMMQVYSLVKSGGLLMIENGSLVPTHYP